MFIIQKIKEFLFGPDEPIELEKPKLVCVLEDSSELWYYKYGFDTFQTNNHCLKHPNILRCCFQKRKKTGTHITGPHIEKNVLCHLCLKEEHPKALLKFQSIEIYGEKHDKFT